ncbi:hypothetical protein CVT26_004959 [Gymnopilus dilepis]|uniref:Uncharacterized protein n=1 Tax=Gymnopilus dilepis TaxID=231916 RepID=A0A409Y053_9AGAR|nr:hypothetical protein CVT26_004959 [Gymnopilus dilepis]
MAPVFDTALPQGTPPMALTAVNHIKLGTRHSFLKRGNCRLPQMTNTPKVLSWGLLPPLAHPQRSRLHPLINLMARALVKEGFFTILFSPVSLPGPTCKSHGWGFLANGAPYNHRLHLSRFTQGIGDQTISLLNCNLPVVRPLDRSGSALLTRSHAGLNTQAGSSYRGWLRRRAALTT